MNFIEYIKNNITILDGAMGTSLQKLGLKVGELPEVWNITHPEIISKIHSDYIAAGANVLYSNTFGASPKKFDGQQYNYQQVITVGIQLAKKAAGSNAFVAQSIGSLGELIYPLGTLNFEDAVDAFKAQIQCGVSAGADIIAFETITDLAEMRAGIIAAKETCNKPIIATMSFEENMHTYTGVSLSAMATTLSSLGADAIGVNCSLGARQMVQIGKELLKWTDLPIIIKANAGLPSPDGSILAETPQMFFDAYSILAKCGVSIFGGCCGTDSSYIAKIAQIKSSQNLVYRKPINKICVCSSSKTVEIDGVCPVGERLNPTGKKLLKTALLERNYDYILSQAIEQVDAGAKILDVNVGLPEIDETAVMTELIPKIQTVVDTPLQIDSSCVKTIEKALRITNGRAIVNSVNGDDKSLDTILPLVKKYGACVIGLTLNSFGIPKTTSERIKIAKHILEKALQYKIPKQAVFIDCLTLTVSAEQEQAQHTLDAISIIKKDLGLKTVLGVSNISFGMPNRELINQVFLSLAMSAGLDLPIINPNIKSLMDSIYAFNVLCGKDFACKNYINRFATSSENAPSQQNASTTTSVEYCIIKGLEQNCAIETKKLLETLSPLDVINNYLIPALDKVGELYENQKIFLPQLIQSAEAAKFGFNEVKSIITANGGEQVKKGKIVLATVEGDVHDIGKNIVKVVLENYGYTIIDLGKNTPIQTIVDTVKKEAAPLVGLSALMTTTVDNMQKTIEQLRKQNVPCKIMVGGAVLTESYAKKIGADYYASDANASVAIAKKVFD